jgi:rod shape-determining protein MreD
VKGWAVVAVVVGVWLAGVAQMAIAPRMGIFHATPNFLLIALGCTGVYMKRGPATALGFAVGLVEGALAGANLTLYVASRTITGFLLGWFNALGVEINAIVIVICAVSVTICAQGILLFLGAHHGPLTPYLAGTIGAAMYNGVIALPVYALLKKVLSDPSRAD